MECLITNRSAKITFFVNKTLHPLYANFRFSLSNRPFVENDTILQQANGHQHAINTVYYNF